MTPTRETIARALAPVAWAALGLADTLAQKNRRTASLRHADAVLRALDAAGLAVVPKEAVGAMIDAGGREVLIDWHCVWASEKCETRFAADCIPDIYRAMIAAAPDVVE